MKKITQLILIVVLPFLSHGQIKPVAQKILNAEQQQKKFQEADLFTVVKSIEKHHMVLPDVEDASFLSLSTSTTALLLDTRPEQLLLNIALADGGMVNLKLVQSNIITDDFRLVNSTDNRPVSYKKGLHYWGIVNNDLGSVAAISIYSDEVMGLVATHEGNFVLGKLDKNNDDIHIFYNDKNIPQKPVLDCATKMEKEIAYTPLQLSRNANLNTTNCVRLYWEASYDIYTGKGSFAATTNYILGLFNQSALLFSNDGIDVLLSELFIWSTPSPYTGTSSFDYLDAFQLYRPTFNGDLGHMLDYNGYGGVAATIDGICSFNNDDRHCYSGISANYQNVPLYSWSVMVVTHEQGHLMGSRHTHACVWNGNGTSIDGCGTSQGYIEGNCVMGPLPANGGTIMSYCHLTSYGINLSYGFGPQPASVIVNTINNGFCLSPCAPVACTTPTGLSVSGVGNTTATLSWNNDPNASGYIIEYHASGTSVWDTLLAASSPVTVNNLSPGVSYTWQVQTLCSEGLTFFSPPNGFQTVPLSCGIPSGLTHGTTTNSSANVSWQPIVGAAYYIIQYAVAGSGIWITDSVASTSYFISGLSASTNYEWQVQTVCVGGAVSGFSSSDVFTTAANGNVITLVIKPGAECGKDAIVTTCFSCPSDTTNYGNDEYLLAEGWANGSANTISRALMQFDLTSIPVGSVVQSAWVSLYYDPSAGNGQHAGVNNGYLIKVVDAWDEKTVTWNNQPQTTIVQNAPLAASTLGTQDYPVINAKNMVQFFVNNPSQNFGMLLKLATEQPYNKLVFASSDHPNAALHPSLTINFIPPVDSCVSLKYASCNGEDVMLSSCIPCGYDTINNGEIGEFDAIAWTNQGNISNTRSLIRWDLSFIPPNAIVHSADLSLYAYNSPENGQHSALSGSNEAVLNKVTSPWNEYTVNWNTMPSITTTGQVTLPASTNPTQDYLNTDVTAFVQDMVANPVTNFGLMMQLVTEQAFRSLIFASSDNPDPAKHPQLNICYTIPTSITSATDQTDWTVINDVKNGVVTFTSSKEFSSATILQLFNVAGQVVYSNENVTGNKVSLKTNYFSQGIYVYRMMNKEKLITGKIVIR